MHQLQHFFEAGDKSAFLKLCKVQEELRGIALHEAKRVQVCAHCQWAEEGETSSSFFLNLATIYILYKKNDRLEIKNWRPISLLNVDYKIATHAILDRLLAVISSIVGPDQTCGVLETFLKTFF